MDAEQVLVFRPNEEEYASLPGVLSERRFMGHSGKFYIIAALSHSQPNL
jgi:hypothetical protein